jgi:hypothetical protein
MPCVWETLLTLEKFRNQNTPNQTSSASSAADLVEEPVTAPADWHHDPTINKGVHAWKLLKIATVPAVPLPNKDRGSVNHNHPNPKAKPTIRLPITLEKDFTTDGPKGDLKCPFSTVGAAWCGNPHRLQEPKPYAATAGLEDPATSPDPIAREFHADVKDEDPTPDGVAPKCPIRFIDQHTPEEVAKYVEKHKHEVPRSHEVCVRRYQANQASIRSLDAKYGSLVKMIQGLSEKHKSMLPADAEAAEESALDDKSKDKVEKWAKEVPDGEAPVIALGVESQHGSEERTGHFERPLEEVRLGESPSRPWGIHVPYDEVQQNHSEAPNGERHSRPSSVARPANAPVHEDDAPRPQGKCPFGHGAPDLAPDASKADLPPRAFHPDKQFLDEALGSDKDKGVPRVIFTGPVFFGYSAEDAAALMGMIPGMVSPGSQH